MRRFLIDVDGVMLNTPHMLLALQGPLGSKRWDGKTYGIPKTVREVCFDNLSFWKELLPMKGAFEGIKRILDAGHEVVFVTSPWIVKGWEQLRRDDMAFFFGELFPDGVPIIFCPANMKHMINGDVLIEDNLSTILKWKEHHPEGDTYMHDSTYLMQQWRSLDCEALNTVNLLHWEHQDNFIFKEMLNG